MQKCSEIKQIQEFSNKLTEHFLPDSCLGLKGLSDSYSLCHMNSCECFTRIN